MDDKTDLGEASFNIPTSFNICNEISAEAAQVLLQYEPIWHPKNLGLVHTFGSQIKILYHFFLSFFLSLLAMFFLGIKFWQNFVSSDFICNK
jgi:hypothetical protein